MLKRTHYGHSLLPYALLAPQLLITFVFFLWPAGQALFEAFHISDPFGFKKNFVGLENFKELFQSPEYLKSFGISFFFSFTLSLLCMSAGLFFASLTHRLLRSKKLFQSMLIWPYAIAPAMAGVLWLFIFHAQYGIVGNFLAQNFSWNPTLNGRHALILLILAASWKQISYNFIFLLSALHAIPSSLLEAASIDGASPFQRFWKITFPLLAPTLFFLWVMNLVFAFFECFGVVHTTTEGGPGGSTSILVYKVFTDGFVGQDLGSSSAQSVILMIMTLILTFLQFKYIERKVQYGGK